MFCDACIVHTQLQEWEKRRRRSGPSFSHHEPEEDGGKKDSGFGSDSSNREDDTDSFNRGKSQSAFPISFCKSDHWSHHNVYVLEQEQHQVSPFVFRTPPQKKQRCLAVIESAWSGTRKSGWRWGTKAECNKRSWRKVSKFLSPMQKSLVCPDSDVWKGEFNLREFTKIAVWLIHDRSEQHFIASDCGQIRCEWLEQKERSCTDFSPFVRSVCEQYSKGRWDSLFSACRIVSEAENKKRPVDPFRERARQKEREKRRLKEEIEKIRQEQAQEEKSQVRIEESHGWARCREKNPKGLKWQAPESPHPVCSTARDDSVCFLSVWLLLEILWNEDPLCELNPIKLQFCQIFQLNSRFISKKKNSWDLWQLSSCNVNAIIWSPLTDVGLLPKMKLFCPCLKKQTKITIRKWAVLE